MKLEWNSLSKVKFVNAELATTQYVQIRSKAGPRLSSVDAMTIVRNCAPAEFGESLAKWMLNLEQLAACAQYPIVNYEPACCEKLPETRVHVN
uniref:Uncharacterized protein n=1 Tax=Knipowitschia caucasica TaxID=637954 RepID=A0AAV2M0H0_KNICA